MYVCVCGLHVSVHVCGAYVCVQVYGVHVYCVYTHARACLFLLYCSAFKLAIEKTHASFLTANCAEIIARNQKQALAVSNNFNI